MTEIRDIEYLVGSKKIRNKTITPYNNIICNFLSDLSKELNLSEESKVYPDIKTLAFWCRKKNIEKQTGYKFIDEDVSKQDLDKIISNVVSIY